jgi:IS1 family transposase
VSNILRTDKQAAVISGLVEGLSIRSVERMTGVHRDTIMRLSGKVGNACDLYLSRTMRNLPCRRIELDEVWCYVGKKQRHISESEDQRWIGDFWVWTAFDPDSKAIVAFHVGKRTASAAQTFIYDLASRMANRVQISSDSLLHYVDAISRNFGNEVDYGQIVKAYETSPVGYGRYSPPKVKSTEKTVVIGSPDMGLISTSGVERSNLNLRMSSRRFTRLTNAFSKRVENLEAAVGLYHGWYNLVRRHRSIGTTPAVALGVADREWTISDLLAVAA